MLMRDVKMPQFAIYCDIDINDSQIKERSVKLLSCTSKVSQQPCIFHFLLCFEMCVSKQNGVRRTMATLKLIVTAVPALHGCIITTEHSTDNMAASLFLPVATRGTTAKKNPMTLKSISLIDRNTKINALKRVSRKIIKARTGLHLGA